MIWNQNLLLLLLCLVLWNPVAEGREFDSNIQVKDATKTLAWDYLYTKHQFSPTCDKTTPLPALPPSVIQPGAPWYVLTYVTGYLVNTLMVGISVGSSLMGFLPSALLHYLGSFLPQKWIPDIILLTVSGLQLPWVIPWLNWLIPDANVNMRFGLAAVCAWWTKRAMLEEAGERTHL
ncbi:hypothetical protein DSO57_1009935 [Entomophthora muscae]|uniref:Uncharacterized protein n=1 Tax=Entomophthora muscae TaxID=34485 RepID=A0ACC2TI59_9FUNG|nr:hypothetical protein DSO57_1009935 [Entomophthora muscae]